MSDRPSHRVARGVALALSLGLASFVIVNAQFGCDSPASNAPPAKDTAPVEPAKRDAEPQPSKPDSEPAVKPDSEPAVADEPANRELVGAGRGGVGESEPVFMPASKSGGNYGSMRFPGEQSPSQKVEPAEQQQQQQQNPAPNK
ncbi:MAG TPA: hypothetical protein VK034_04435 [Enhygromyxa sp.]|nr:hypothetical protein [Enhygromyxa sp.]